VLVKQGDAEAMAEAVTRLLGDPDLLDTLGANAAREGRERFDLKQQAAAYIAWYEEIIAMFQLRPDRTASSARSPLARRESSFRSGSARCRVPRHGDGGRSA
jgi:hypothetical protein